MSSVGLAFRALVMLACLALVPFLAIYGKQLPDFYRAVVDAYKARTQAKTADPLAGLGKRCSGLGPDQRAADRRIRFRAAARAWRRILSQLRRRRLPSADWGSSDQAARPLVVLTAGRPRPPVRLTGAGELFRRRWNRANRPIRSPHPLTTANATRRRRRRWPPPTPTTQFRHVEVRLRELERPITCLETFGDGYRFYCEVAIAGNTHSGRNCAFQATDADPLTAMKRVLD